MGTHRSNVDINNLASPVRTLRAQIQSLQEKLARRPNSAPAELAEFPDVVSGVLGTLVEKVKDTSASLMSCARVVSKQASKLQEYLAEADAMAAGPAAHVDQLEVMQQPGLETHQIQTGGEVFEDGSLPGSKRSTGSRIGSSAVVGLGCRAAGHGEGVTG